MKLVVVEWHDILATAGWEKEDEVEPQRMWTVGYLVYKDKKERTPRTRKENALRSTPSRRDV